MSAPLDDSWDEPLSLRLRDLPPFPTATLPRRIREFVTLLAANAEVPEDLPGILALGVLASTLAKKIVVSGRGSFSEPVNLMVMLVLPPSERKSSTFGALLGPVLERDKLHWLARSSEPGESGDSEQRPEDGLSPRLLADDATPEALARLLAENGGRLCVAAPEGGFLGNIAGRYANGMPNLDVVLKGYSGDPVIVDRRGAPPVRIEAPALTLIFAVQPDVLKKLTAHQEFVGRGLVARFLVSLPRSRIGSRTLDGPPVDPVTLHEYHDVIGRLLDLPVPEVPRRLAFSPEASELWLAFGREIEEQVGESGELFAIRATALKMQGAVARIAGLFHATEEALLGCTSTTVSREVVGRTIELGRYFLEHAKAALSTEALDPVRKDALALLPWLARRRTTTVRRIQAGCKKRFPNVGAVRAAVAVLEECGYLRAVPTARASNVGRTPDATLYVYPHIANRLANGSE